MIKTCVKFGIMFIVFVMWLLKQIHLWEVWDKIITYKDLNVTITAHVSALSSQNSQICDTCYL